MDKQMIEEMAKDICSPCHKGKLGLCEPKEGGVVWEYAKNAVEQGYRKIPEGAVVISPCYCVGHNDPRGEDGVSGFEQIRKETAEKYHAKMCKAIDSVPNATKEFVEAWKSKNDKICKEISEGK